MNGEVVGAGEPDHQCRSWDRDGEDGGQSACESKNVPACGGAEREYVGAGGQARESERDSDFSGLSQPRR